MKASKIELSNGVGPGTYDKSNEPVELPSIATKD
jgi:hypothetical protein